MDNEVFNEADTRAKLITPRLHKRGWNENMICREQNAGGIEWVGSKPRRRNKRSDYTLRIPVEGHPQFLTVAVIEAKKSSLPAEHGIEQAQEYARRMNVPFVFSSNGYRYVEYDNYTGETSKPRTMERFPKPQELQERYEAGQEFKISDESVRPLLQSYPGGDGVRRYYQDAAIRATLEKLARNRNNDEPGRALLSLATGAGKTFIAANLLYRIYKGGLLRRALFLCDRSELREQALAAMNHVFGSDAAVAEEDGSGNNCARNAVVHIATYQTLGVALEDGDASFLRKHYPPGFFSHIIIDECHRSAWRKWSEVLRSNENAAHIGMTATPRMREDTSADGGISRNNREYFGEPVYQYSISQGSEDGYLAACDIRRANINLDDLGITVDEVMERNPINHVTGEPATREEVEEMYKKTEYEDKIMLPDRVWAMCKNLFDNLTKHGGPTQKTIIFCVRDTHAGMVARDMNNLYAEWCRQNGNVRAEPYAFKCTAESGGSNFLPELRNSSRHHFVATTVDLLTTGVDIPCVKNIVFFCYRRSPISVYQMIGRGIRIYEAGGKLSFKVHDYTGATDLLGQDIEPPFGGGGGGEGGKQREIIQAEGFDVEVSDVGNFLLVEQEGGGVKRVSPEEYRRELAVKLLKDAPTLDELRNRWVMPRERQELLESLSGHSVALLRRLQQMDDYDLYDVLAALFGAAPKTRRERADAFVYKHKNWMNNLSKNTVNVLEAIIEEFAAGGTDSLEDLNIFNTEAVRKAGGLDALNVSGNAAELLEDVKTRIFAA